jgi:hypothetical protein
MFLKKLNKATYFEQWLYFLLEHNPSLNFLLMGA